MIKKLIVTIAALCLLLSVFSLQGCSKKADLAPFVSQMRTDVLKGESENYEIRCYAETREKPLLPDGKKQNVSPAVIIKLKIKTPTEVVSGAKVTFKTDTEYSAVFAFRPESDTYVALCYVYELPEDCLTVTVTVGETSENAELSSVKTPDLADPLAALSFAQDSYGEFFDGKEYSEGKFEINIRLLEAEDGLYYYVGFITERKTEAFLISKDAKSVIARKTLSN